jgi:hypothetical protein
MDPITVVTDDNGEFEVPNFFPGTDVQLSVDQPFADGARLLGIGILEAGEVRDVGTLEVRRRE